MGIDADFWFTIPPDADFPDDVTVERAEDNAPGDTRTYFHQGILSETEKDLKAALDGQDQYREQCRSLSSERRGIIRQLKELRDWLSDDSHAYRITAHNTVNQMIARLEPVSEGQNRGMD